jgi:hypothetical protein
MYDNPVIIECGKERKAQSLSPRLLPIYQSQDATNSQQRPKTKPFLGENNPSSFSEATLFVQGPLSEI